MHVHWNNNKILGVFAVNFEQYQHFQQVLLLLTLIKCVFSECVDYWPISRQWSISPWKRQETSVFMTFLGSWSSVKCS